MAMQHGERKSHIIDLKSYFFHDVILKSAITREGFDNYVRANKLRSNSRLGSLFAFKWPRHQVPTLRKNIVWCKLETVGEE